MVADDDFDEGLVDLQSLLVAREMGYTGVALKACKGQTQTLLLAAAPLLVLFLAVDIPFFSANVAKLLSGGWVPLAIGAVVFTVMTTWSRGRKLLGEAFVAHVLPLDVFMADVVATKPMRVPGARRRTAAAISSARGLIAAML